jgi:cytochrome P450
MTAQREDPLKPAWIRDQLDCFEPPELEAAFFDPDLKAWVFSRHTDVLAAFHSPHLIPGRRDLGDFCLETEESARLKMREEVRNALSSDRVRDWCADLSARANDLCRQLPVEEPIDLVRSYSRPLCLHFAAMVTGIGENDAQRAEELAQAVSAATVDPESAPLRAAAKDANRKLRSYFNAGPESLRDSGFVGLSQTLLRIINAALFVLIQFPDQWCVLRNSPQSIDRAIEEILRYVGVIRLLSRTAIEDIDVNGVSIHKGDQVLLRVFAASHDPARFERPMKLNCERRDASHFTFGAGGHACVAANLNRMAAIAMIVPVLTRFDSARLARPVEWHGGSVMRSPASLWALLSCT